MLPPPLVASLLLILILVLVFAFLPAVSIAVTLLVRIAGRCAGNVWSAEVVYNGRHPRALHSTMAAWHPYKLRFGNMSPEPRSRPDNPSG